MNETKPLEIQLRSWAPRRPSPKLSRLIRKRAAEAEETPPAAFRFGWVAPAMAALMLLGVVLNQRTNPAISGGSGSNTLVAMMMISNPGAPAYLPGSFQSAHNSLTAESFEWTNDSRSTSSIGSLSRPKGN